MSKHNDAMKRRYAGHVAAGNCGLCGRPREPVEPNGATGTRCKSCAEKARERDRRIYTSRIAAGACSCCGKHHNFTKPSGRKSSRCADCDRKRRNWERDRCAEKPGFQPVFGPSLTDEPRYMGRGAKPLGPSASVRFAINQPTLDAINILKQRYRDANDGKLWRGHVSEILRDAVAGVLKKGGPVPVERERICVRGWHFTLRMPVAQYQQITHIANAKFDGSRAMAVRVAIRQAVTPPFVCASGGKRILGGKPHDPWDDD
ncbi:MAG: hypothetical protein H8F28_25115 [Fibrella sp.]|nr:hypothetical protein [Armatimonadota bacterium]